MIDDLCKDIFPLQTASHMSFLVRSFGESRNPGIRGNLGISNLSAIFLLPRINMCQAMTPGEIIRNKRHERRRKEKCVR